MSFKRKKLCELRKKIKTAEKPNEEQPFSPNHTETIKVEMLADPLGSSAVENEKKHTDVAAHNENEADTPTTTMEQPNSLLKPLSQTPPSSPPPTNLIRSIRGRKCQPENWKKNKRRRLRQAGQEYVNSSGKTIGPRQVRAACPDTCYHKCNERFSVEQRQRIHDAFWRLSDEQKNYFYWKYTARIEPKRRRRRIKRIPIKQSSSADEADEAPVVETASRRGCTIIYRFEVKGEMLTVCSVFFFATLDITARRVYYFYNNFYDVENCMPRIEAQPYARSPRKEPTIRDLGARLEELRSHIASFPSTRYSGSTKKRYLAADLNLTRMYKMYAETAKDPLKQHWYNKVFNKEFYLGFRGVHAEERRIAKLKAKKAERVELPCVVETKQEQELQLATPQEEFSAAGDTIQAPQGDGIYAPAIPAAPTIVQPVEYTAQYNSYSWLNGFENYNNNNYQ